MNKLGIVCYISALGIAFAALMFAAFPVHAADVVTPSLRIAFKTTDGVYHGFCSGTHIGDGVIVTANHCKVAADMMKTQAKKTARIFAQAKDGEFYQLSWVKGDAETDIATAKAPGLEGAPSAKLNCATVVQGAPIWSVNSPFGMSFLKQTGYVMESELLPAIMATGGGHEGDVPDSTTWKDHQIAFLPSGPGASGGPVFNSAGELAGVIVGQVPQQQSMMTFESGPAMCRVVGRTS